MAIESSPTIAPVDIDGETLTPNLGTERNGFIDMNQMAVLTGDMTAYFDFVLADVFGEGNLDPKIREGVNVITGRYLQPYVEMFKRMFPGRAYIISEDESDRILEQIVANQIGQNPERVVLFNDRFLGRRLNLEKKCPFNFFRVSSTRHLTGGNTGFKRSEIIPRPGDPPIEKQLDAIEQKLEEIGRSLKNAEVIIGDDTTVTQSTEEGLANLLIQRGARVLRDQSFYVYQIWLGKPDPARKRVNTGGRVIKRVASTEQRELAIDGPLIRLGTHLALQNPGQAPWGDGGITRTNGRIDRLYLDLQLLRLYRNVVKEIEEQLLQDQALLRKDGSIFGGFTLGDFRWKVPYSPFFNPSTLIRSYIEKYRVPPRSLHDLKLLEYIDLAIATIEQDIKPDITHIFLDLDGTVLQMRYPHPTKRNFYHSVLGEQVMAGFIDLLSQFSSGTANNVDDLLSTINIKRPTHVLQTLNAFSEFLENQFGEETKTRLLQRFVSFYGPEQGTIEFRKFIEEYPYLPFSYHVLREYTWGQIDFDKTYNPESGKAKEFTIQALQRGGTMIFLSSGPKIHSMRLLEETGLVEYVTNGKVELITVEDLYDPETLEEQSKLVVYVALSVQNDTIAKRIFEYAKNETGLIADVDQAMRTYLRLRDKFKDKRAAHPRLILGIGDQPWSDIRTVITAGGGKDLIEGGYGYLVDGPDLLSDIFSHANIRSLNAILEEAAQGREVKTETITDGIVFDGDDSTRYRSVYLEM